MLSSSKNLSIKPLLPVKLGKGEIHFAQGVRAGRWIFVAGLLAQDFKNGIAPAVTHKELPHSGLPKGEKETTLIFDHLEKVLEAGGTNLANVVRTDQYYTSVKAVPPYQSVRHVRFGAQIPPSTSIVQGRMVLPDGDLQVQAIAVLPEDGFQPQHLTAENLEARETAGYSPGLAVGDFVFIAGITSMAQPGEPQNNALPLVAQLEKGVLWGGVPVELETEFIINERIMPALELAGATCDDMVKVQVYLTNPDDYSAFNKIWTQYFKEHPPALSVIPCADRGLFVEDGRVEINIIAVKKDGATKKEYIDAGVFPGFSDQPQGILAGDLLFLSALMAIDENGLASGATLDPRQPLFQSTAAAQAEHILDNVERLCEAAGTSLRNIVRVQQFHTDIAEFYSVNQVLARRLNGQPIPFSAIEVPHPLPVPGCTVMLDIWVYAP